MRKSLLVLFAAAAILIMACDASALVSQFLPQKGVEQAQQTIEAVAPTVAAVATSGVPTKSAVSGTQPGPTKPATVASGSSANPFGDALAKAKAAAKYRVQFSWIFGGMDKGKYAEQPFFDFTGEIDNGKSHLISKGGLMAMLAVDANTPVEIIEADGKTYMKGVSMFGLTDPKLWYISDDSSSSSFADFAKPDEFNDWTGGSTSDFIKTRTESLDSQSCDVYVQDVKSMQNAALLGMLGTSQDKNDFSAVDKGEMDFWLCRDGYVHKFLLDYQGHDQKDATQKAALKMTWHAWDFNISAISVQAPKDAKPMPK